MRFTQLYAIGIVLLSAFTLTNCNSAAPAGNGYLLQFTDSASGNTGYKDQQGKVVIAAGKYNKCMTDTFTTYAVVAKEPGKYIGIDRSENKLFDVFFFENGPDYPSEGLFRIIDKNKIGYADEKTGKIVIPASYSCAWPFKSGIAMVSDSCSATTEGEHSTWTSNQWYYVDKAGKKTDGPIVN